MRKPHLGGAVYIIPKLLTTGNLFGGFFSVVKALEGNFYLAGVAILLAAVFDMLDGRVARLVKGTSEFGVQYDSLCDLLSFGFAPAFLCFQMGLSDLGRMGWIVCFVYLACGALRLARFNVQSAIGSASNDFTGLPIPMAAAVIACFATFVSDPNLEATGLGFLKTLAGYLGADGYRDVFLLATTFFLALLMISNIQFRSHKALKIGGIKPFKLLAASVFAIGVLAYQPEAMGFLLCLFYAMSGPLEWMIGWKRLTEDVDIFGPQEDDQTLIDSPDPRTPPTSSNERRIDDGESKKGKNS